jgi:mannose-6-phosphate isomerase-like protein (cupin superfamily)
VSTARTPATRPDPLARCVGDPRRFASERWGRRPHLHRSDDLLEDVLTVDDVDAILASAARRPLVRVMRDGEAVDPRSWSGEQRLGGRVVPDVVDPGAVARLLHEGATVVLQSLHRTVPSVGRFAAALEARVSHPVQVNAYLTPPGSAGLAAHADGHDVVAVQLHGAKRWWVDGLGELTLEAGDRLYVPAGTRHRASTEARSSLHLTIGIIPITYRAVLQRVLALAGELDAPLPLGFAEDPDSESRRAALERGLADALQRAAKTIVDADPAEVAARERRRRRLRLRHDGLVASVVGLDDLGPVTVVQLRGGPAPRLTAADDGRIRLDLHDRVLHLPSGARGALERLLDGAPCTVGDLPELAPESRLVVARRLVVEGMLRIVG